MQIGYPADLSCVPRFCRRVVEGSENGDLHIVRHITTKDKLSISQSSAGEPY